MSGQHALVAPSGLHLTMACAASLLLQAMAGPRPPTEETLEGDAAHWHAVQYAQGNKLGLGTKFKSGGREWEVDADMLHGSQLWAYNTCRGSSGRFESPVAIPVIHALCWGTPDYWQSRAPEALFVKDYKYGHRYVDPFENWQMIAYAVGIAGFLGLTDPNLPVVLGIVQPRAYHRDGPVKEWRITLGALWGYIPRIVARVTEALSPEATATTGPHCMDCDARHLCKTLQRGAMHVVEFTGTADAVGLDNDSLGVEARILLQAQTVLDARLEGLKTQIESLIRSGKAVPYWGMEPGRSKWDWNEGTTVETVRLLGLAANGVQTVNHPKPMTPTQCKNAGVDEAILDVYATRKPAGVSLKPISTDKTRRVFGANKA